MIAKDSRGVLDALASLLERCAGAAIEVAGHTDADGPEDLNQRLSQARARAVVDALINRGVRPEAVVAKGYGESVPIADNATSEGRARNRRIEFQPVN